jgi:hypothetical protein
LSDAHTDTNLVRRAATLLVPEAHPRLRRFACQQSTGLLTQLSYVGLS